MFSQRDPRLQGKPQAFQRANNVFQKPEPMQITGNSGNQGFRSNNNAQHEFDASRRGGRQTARRGGGQRGRGAKTRGGRGRGQPISTSTRGNLQIDFALDQAIAGTPVQQPQRKPRSNQQQTSQGSVLDDAISGIISKKGSHKQPFKSKPSTKQPFTTPFTQQQQGSVFAPKETFVSAFGQQNEQHISPFSQQQQQQKGQYTSAFAQQPQQGQYTNAFIQQQQQHVSPFAQTQKDTHVSAFGQQAPATPFGQQHTSPFEQKEQRVSPFKQQPKMQSAFSQEQHASPFAQQQQQPSPFAQQQASSFQQQQASSFQQQQPSPFAQQQPSSFQQQQPSSFNQKQPSSFQQQPSSFNKPSKEQPAFKTAFKAGSNAKKKFPSSDYVDKTGPSAFNAQVLSSPVAAVIKKRRGTPSENEAKRVQLTENKRKQPTAPKTTTAADRAVRFGSTEKTIIYDEMKKSRVMERQDAIKRGLIPDPDARTRLEEAIDFRGCCEVMCPEFEMIEREIQNNIDPMERNEEGEVDPDKMVKAYRRSAAGLEQPLPSDVRSVDALIMTLDYLIDDVLSKNSLEVCHGFIRDRTRSIRQDFTRQNIRDVHAIYVFERIARFHIMCLHEMCEFDENKFSHQQEVEQLRKVLISLMEFYDDLREEGVQTENEAEFRAYHILVHIRDQDIVRQTMTLPLAIFNHPDIQLALEFHGLAQRSNEIKETSSRRNKPLNVPASQNFYTQFFKTVAKPETPFLMACLLEASFSDVRKGALKAMNVAYVYKLSGVPAAYVERVLYYDTMKQLMEEAQLYGLVVDVSLGEPTIRFGQKHYKNKQAVFREPLTNPPQRRSAKLVEPKKANRSFRDIINNENHVPLTSSVQDASKKKMPFVPRTNEEDEGAQDGKVKQAEAFKAAADAAEAAAAKEREKMEALMAQQAAAKKAEMVKKAQLEAEAKRKEQEAVQRQLAEKAELEKREKARLEMVRVEEEKRRVAHQRELEKKRQEEERKRRQLDKHAIAREMYLNLMSRFIEDAAMEQVNAHIVKRKHIIHFIKRKTAPWLANSRARIQERNNMILNRNKLWHFSMNIHKNNPFTKLEFDGLLRKSLVITPEVKKDRSWHAYQWDVCGIQHNKYKTEEEKHQAIWKKENMHPYIEQDVREKANQDLVKDKEAWTTLIYCAPNAIHSKKWFRHKCNLDEWDRKVSYYKSMNITTNLLDSTTGLYPQLCNDIGSIVFALPEQETTTDKHDNAFWESQKQRLRGLWDALKKYRPDVQVPLLITYFPDDASDIQETLYNIPSLLGFESELAVTEYHILIMNPDTIPTRFFDEMLWLSGASVA